MAAYGLDYWKVYDTPLRLFWVLSRNVDRMRAEEDMRRARASVAVQSGKEPLQNYLRELQAEVGTVFVEKAFFDASGWNELKAMAGA